MSYTKNAKRLGVKATAKSLKPKGDSKLSAASRRDPSSRVLETTKTTKTESVRERKRRETRFRIAERGLQMFAEMGYDATTLEAVARAAEVSPRTLYSYFSTKFDILLFWHDSGFTAGIRPALVRHAESLGPFASACACLLELVQQYESDELVVADRVWNSTEGLRAQKQLMFLEIEEALHGALVQRWPELAADGSLRLTAMLVVGAQRLAMEIGRQPGEDRTLYARLTDAFDTLKQQLNDG